MKFSTYSDPSTSTYHQRHPCGRVEALQIQLSFLPAFFVFCGCFLPPVVSLIKFPCFPCYVVQLQTHQLPKMVIPSRQIFGHKSTMHHAGCYFCNIDASCSCALSCPEIRHKNCIHYLRTNVSDSFFIHKTRTGFQSSEFVTT
jgi:hypothetical protein